MSKTGLILAGHGSHISPNTAGRVWELVDRLRAEGVADEIAAAFWKEMPSFHQVLGTLTADDVTIVPVFTARGYFTEVVIPAEMGLQTTQTWRALRYTAPVGEHPLLTEIVYDRVVEWLDRTNTPPADVTVAVVGHGTQRNSQSRTLAEDQAAVLRSKNLVRDVVAVYLDDVPNIRDVYAMTATSALLVVPFFMTAGSHTSIDIPERLGLESGQITGQVAGRSVCCTLPVGLDESLYDVVRSLAGAAFYPRQNTSSWDCFPGAGRDDFIHAVYAAGTLILGDLEVTPNRIYRAGDADANIHLDSPAALRRWCREDPFRPLSTAAGLPSGWYVEIDTPDMLHAVVETLYPGAVADWARYQRKSFRTSTLHETAIRQTGILRDVDQLNTAQQTSLIAQICTGCVRHPTWFHGVSPAGAIPCPEPCNFWLSVTKGVFQ
jgi:sirohydrochlorin cobaltochelatase